MWKAFEMWTEVTINVTSIEFVKVTISGCGKGMKIFGEWCNIEWVEVVDVWVSEEDWNIRGNGKEETDEQEGKGRNYK